ncbi:nicotinamide riboside transporter PnuC [Aliidiomarina sanyensis]|uniref:Nicotinamide riboside transporter PnuC n=1 Tax=Aliidiomarina sanyensis TaxID=1249555 RepID=A0A432WEQ5_9GAMM|nr:nicotinamide riboside transporter PnuC [Aliidiomarina sanyensis]RUO31361.1 nicotinamide mononucleotide transporter [Aliidiomarina sanyensis]
MRIQVLDKIIGEWQRPWALVWFFCGAAALGSGFWWGTERTTLDMLMLCVALIGLICVVALAFRRNLTGNGLGLAANMGESIVQGRVGATGLVLAPLFYFLTHLYGLVTWRKHQDREGNMRPRSANTSVWWVTAGFIFLGLAIFPWLNAQLQTYSFLESSTDVALHFLGWDLSWYQINVVAFVLGVTAQTTMILRYSFSWLLWIAVNFVWLAVNLANQNYIFAIQTMVYQVNAFIGLYGWWRSSRGDLL